jgi:hypothetical protein
MRIVSRQNHNLAGAKDKVLAFDADVKFAFDDVMVNDQVGRRTEGSSAVLARNARGHAPRGKEIGVQEHAAGQMRHPQDV